MSQTVSVVVPVYNEADYIPTALPALIDTMERTGADYTIHLVENGSSDGTAEAARTVSNDRVLIDSLPEPDYGNAMRTGFLAATGDWVVNFDIDYFSSEFIDAVLAQPEGVDLVIGSKRDPSSDDRRPPIRRLATRVFNVLLKVILGSGVSDTHGMKGFRRALVEEMTPKVVSNKDLFDTELVIRAERAGYVIVEVPVTVEETRHARSSLVKRVPRTVAGLFRVRRAIRAEAR